MLTITQMWWLYFCHKKSKKIREDAYPGHEGIAPGIVELGGLPVHPLLHASTLSCRGWQQIGALAAAGQVAADGVKARSTKTLTPSPPAKRSGSGTSTSWPRNSSAPAPTPWASTSHWPTSLWVCRCIVGCKRPFKRPSLPPSPLTTPA